jgi:hypothetical protein
MGEFVEMLVGIAMRKKSVMERTRPVLLTCSVATKCAENHVVIAMFLNSVLVVLPSALRMTSNLTLPSVVRALEELVTFRNTVLEFPVLVPLTPSNQRVFCVASLMEIATNQKCAMVTALNALLISSNLLPLFADAATVLVILKNIVMAAHPLVLRINSKIRLSFAEQLMEIAISQKLAQEMVLIVLTML